MSGQINMPRSVAKAGEILVEKPTAFFCSMGMGAALVMAESKPLRYLQRTLRPDIPQGEYISIRERYLDGYWAVQEAFGNHRR